VAAAEVAVRAGGAVGVRWVQAARKTSRKRNRCKGV